MHLTRVDIRPIPSGGIRRLGEPLSSLPPPHTHPRPRHQITDDEPPVLPEALFPRSVPENAELADLIASCLHKDFEKRVTAEALLLHPFIRRYATGALGSPVVAAYLAQVFDPQASIVTTAQVRRAGAGRSGAREAACWVRFAFAGRFLLPQDLPPPPTPTPQIFVAYYYHLFDGDADMRGHLQTFYRVRG